MEKNTSNGISFPILLFVIFATLKLAGSIDWSWWWVASPIWIPFLIGFGLMVFAIFFFTTLILLGYSEKDIEEKLKKK